MKYGITTILIVGGLLFCLRAISAENPSKFNEAGSLPPIETFVIEPIIIQNISTWVPANKTGPEINRACRPKRGLMYYYDLPSTVNHTKTELCPGEIARLLAEYVSNFHVPSLPLTIFNGWQWEYYYSMTQYEAATYDLPQRGGSWENCWEAILTQTLATIEGRWMRVPNSGLAEYETDENNPKSDIEVTTFSFVRTRNGYPKERKL